MICNTMKVLVLVVMATMLMTTQAQTDEDLKRPYSFGFNIENMQHRQEKKDERGIIMGEFGFITADGWYLTTIYATDEQGRFIIVGRKRERVGPPVNPYAQVSTSARPPPVITTTARPITPTTYRPSTPNIFKGIQGCSNCLIPTTTPRPPIPSPALVSSTAGFVGSRPQTSPPSNFRPEAIRPPVTPRPSSFRPSPPSTPSSFRPSSGPPVNVRPNSGPPVNVRPNSGQPINVRPVPSSPSRPLQPNNFRPGPTSTPSGFRPSSGPTTPSGFRPSSDAFPSPTTGRPFAQSSFSSTPINNYNRPTPSPLNNRPNPISNNRPLGGNLPSSNPNDPSGLNYRFNYEVGYHGHQETGYTDGTKVGNYFVNSRDGTGLRVAYQANEGGYQPVISQVKLSPNQTPRKQDEKEAGLKNYEFVWFRR